MVYFVFVIILEIWIAEHESVGYDFCFNDRCVDMAVDLNALVYVYEKDLEYIYTEIFKNKRKADFTKEASKRKSLVNKYMWNEQSFILYDNSGKRNHFALYWSISCGLVWPLVNKQSSLWNF